MAETAGTIGIPVYKNEVLPALEHFARRRERAEQLKAAQAQKEAMLKYKEAEERNKFAYGAMPAVGGNYYTDLMKNMQNADLEVMKTAAADRSKTIGDLTTLGNTVKTNTEYRNNITKQRSEEIDKAAKQFDEIGLSITPEVVQKHISTRYQGSPVKDQSFFEQTDVPGVIQTAMSDPKNINPAKIGANAIKDIQKAKLQIETPGGKVEDLEYVPVVKIGEKKGPLGQTITGATEIDIPAAEAYVDRQPKLKELKNAWISKTAEQYMYRPEIVGSNLPEADKQARANEAATKDFYEQAFGQVKTEKFGRRYEGKRTSGGGGTSAYKDIQITPTTVRVKGASNVVTQVPTIAVTPTKFAQMDISLPLNSDVVNIRDGSESTTSEGKYVVSPNIGYMARDKKSGKYIPPTQWGSTPLTKDIEFVPGIYASTASLQEITTGSEYSTQGQQTKYQKPTLLGEMVFIPEGSTGNFETIADNVLREKGQGGYSSVKNRMLKETKKKFLQSRFRTPVK